MLTFCIIKQFAVFLHFVNHPCCRGRRFGLQPTCRQFTCQVFERFGHIRLKSLSMHAIYHHPQLQIFQIQLCLHNDLSMHLRVKGALIA